MVVTCVTLIICVNLVTCIKLVTCVTLITWLLWLCINACNFLLFHLNPSVQLDIHILTGKLHAISIRIDFASAQALTFIPLKHFFSSWKIWKILCILNSVEVKMLLEYHDLNPPSYFLVSVICDQSSI